MSQIEVIEVILDPIDTVEVVIEPITVIEIDTPGPQGAIGATSTVPGPTGPTGSPGPAGPAGSNFTYHHVQNTPASTWVIVHNLNGYPNISIVDSAGTVVEGEVTYNSANQITMTFTGSFAGDAYLS